MKAYATNSSGTSYGNQQAFTSSPILATIATTSVTFITSTNAISGGIITSDGGGSITMRGVCWSTSPNPTNAGSKTIDGIGIGSFSSSPTLLNPNTLYYLRAYATNSAGTAYGNELTFTTLLNPILPTVTTTNIFSIFPNSSSSGGNVISDGGSSIIFRGVCWSTSPNPTLVNNYTTDGSGTGIYFSTLTNLTQATQYYIRAYAMNSVGTVYGSELIFNTATSCPGVSTVTYGGKNYPTVQIGTQCWLAQNLNIGNLINNAGNQANNSIIEKYCYNDLESNCDIYGGLYQWAEMVQYLNGATNSTSWDPIPTGNVQGICPTGWHLPKDAEWTTLANFLGGYSVAGGKMKDVDTINWASPNTGATNASYFTAMPGGFRNYTGGFANLKTGNFIWPGEERAPGSVLYCLLTSNSAAFQRTDCVKTYGFSVRCMKD